MIEKQGHSTLPSTTILKFKFFLTINNAVNIVLSNEYARLWLTAGTLYVCDQDDISDSNAAGLAAASSNHVWGTPSFFFLERVLLSDMTKIRFQRQFGKRI